ncbi:hypothetical protein R1flu_008671 [Riccia fluitans]|uniref:Uncharacterized protein n=1 Tax=Riccia fluitans TaxID=41844 RepID=A0ABD1YCB3_9MARC
MVFELLRDCLTLEDPTSGFDLLFDLCTHIAQGQVSPSMAYLLGASRLLTLEKPSGGIRPIVVGEVLYRHVARTLEFQFWEALVDHFSLYSLVWPCVEVARPLFMVSVLH